MGGNGNDPVQGRTSEAPLLHSQRHRLPTRRNSCVFDLWFEGQRYFVGYSRYGYFGPIAEAFVWGPKVGSQMDAILATSMTSLSIALQSGVPLRELAESALRKEDGEPADLIGAILDALVREG